MAEGIYFGTNFFGDHEGDWDPALKERSGGRFSGAFWLEGIKAFSKDGGGCVPLITQGGFLQRWMVSRRLFVIISTLDEQTDCLLTDANILHFRVEVDANSPSVDVLLRKYNDVSRTLHLDLKLFFVSISELPCPLTSSILVSLAIIKLTVLQCIPPAPGDLSSPGFHSLASFGSLQILEMSLLSMPPWPYH